MTPEESFVSDALRQMYAKGWLDISVIAECCELLGIPTHTRAYKALHLLHCMDFSDMSEETLRQVPDLLSQALSSGERTMRIMFEDTEEVIEGGVVRRRLVRKRRARNPRS